MSYKSIRLGIENVISSRVEQYYYFLYDERRITLYKVVYTDWQKNEFYILSYFNTFVVPLTTVWDIL